MCLENLELDCLVHVAEELIGMHLHRWKLHILVLIINTALCSWDHENCSLVIHYVHTLLKLLKA